MDLLKLAFEHTNWTLPPVESMFAAFAPMGVQFERVRARARMAEPRAQASTRGRVLPHHAAQVVFLLKEEHWFLDPIPNSPDARQFRGAAYSMCGVVPEHHVRGEILFVSRPAPSASVPFANRFFVDVEDTCAGILRHAPSLVDGTVAYLQGMNLCERVSLVHRVSMLVIAQSSDGIVIPFMSPGSVVIYVYAPLTLLPEWKTLGWQSDVRFLEYLPEHSEAVAVRT